MTRPLGAAVALSLGVALLSACPAQKQRDPHPDVPDAGSTSDCRGYSAAQRVGAVPPELGELSGLSASTYPGVFWAHNDSGNALELFAIRESGEVLARFTFNAATATDAEDLALGPCADGAPEQCLYLGDIGDNTASRPSVRVLKFVEPDPLGAATPLDAEVIAFRYPDGARDAEGLFVDAHANVYVVSKTPQSLGDVYRLPAGASVEAVKLATLRAPSDKDVYSTGASLHPSGGRLLLRTYGRVWEFTGAEGGTVEALASSIPVERPAAAEQVQAEAICYLADGRGYLLGTEGAGGGLFRIDCQTSSH